MPFDSTPSRTVASQLRELLDHGRHWGQGALNEHGRYCLIGGLARVAGKLDEDYLGRAQLTTEMDKLPGWDALKWAIYTFGTTDAAHKGYSHCAMEWGETRFWVRR